MEINIPSVVAEVTAAFNRYEKALNSNDVSTLDELFWNSPHTLRYGVGEQLYGYDQIAAFRSGRDPGFVVNRLLAKVMGEAARAVYEGTPLLTVEKAFSPLGLPMSPFQLIDLVGWKVAAHVQDTMASAFPERFYANENFHELAELPQVVEKDKNGKVTGWTKPAEKILKPAVGTAPAGEDEILRRVQDGPIGQGLFF